MFGGEMEDLPKFPREWPKAAVSLAGWLWRTVQKRNGRPVDYGVRRIAEAMGCSEARVHVGLRVLRASGWLVEIPQEGRYAAPLRGVKHPSASGVSGVYNTPETNTPEYTPADTPANTPEYTPHDSIDAGARVSQCLRDSGTTEQPPPSGEGFSQGRDQPLADVCPPDTIDGYPIPTPEQLEAERLADAEARAEIQAKVAALFGDVPDPKPAWPQYEDPCYLSRLKVWPTATQALELLAQRAGKPRRMLTRYATKLEFASAAKPSKYGPNAWFAAFAFAKLWPGFEIGKQLAIMFRRLAPECEYQQPQDVEHDSSPRLAWESVTQPAHTPELQKICDAHLALYDGDPVAASATGYGPIQTAYREHVREYRAWFSENFQRAWRERKGAA